MNAFIGQNYGAGKKDRVRKSLRVCLGLSLSTASVILTFLFIACHPLYRIFTTDREVIEIGTYMLRFIAPSYLIYTLVEIFSGTLRGMGNVLIPTLITLGGVCLIRLPWVLFVVPAYGQLSTLLLSYPVAWAATALLLVPYYFWKMKK